MNITPASDLDVPPANGLGPFFEGARTGRLLVQECLACGRRRFPPALRCPACGSGEAAWTPASGRGSVWSFCVFHKPYLAGFDTPYTVAIIELEERVRLLSRVLDVGPGGVRIGMPVKATFAVGPAGDPLVYFSPEDAR